MPDRGFFFRLEDDPEPSVQDFGDAAQGGQRVALVTGGFQAADLLLGGLEEFGEFLLGKPGLLA